MSEHLTREQLDAAAKVELEKIKALPQPLKPKDKTAIPAQPMPQLEPSYRARVMEEVAQGYTEAQAIVEANRCLACKKPFCVESCPVHIDIPAFIAKIAEGDFKAAIAKIKETSLLPAICGRVCPQERQCQMNCTMGKMHKDVNQAVAIGRLERFAADFELGNQFLYRGIAFFADKVRHFFIHDKILFLIKLPTGVISQQCYQKLKILFFHYNNPNMASFPAIISSSNGRIIKSSAPPLRACLMISVSLI